MNSTPRDLGYAMPAEWEPQAAIWTIWPDPEQEWLCPYEPVAEIFGRLVAEISTDQRVELLVNTEADRRLAERLVHESDGDWSRVRVHEIPTNDCWTRDSGPTFVRRRGPKGSELAAVRWRFGAWGGKYASDLDAQVSRRITEFVGCPHFEPGIQFEGGSIDVNGHGTLLTTEQCLLNPNRNPGRSRAELEEILRSHLAVDHIVWLGEGLEGDDTDGHVDDLTRFVNPNTVVTAVERDPSDTNFKPLDENRRRLERAKDQAGRPLTVIPLPMPARLDFSGHRVPASYANFLITNAKVLVPIFEDPMDRVALETLGPLFPDRQVNGLRANELVTGFGAFHCVTQQQPA